MEKLKVVAYARVSTEMQEKKESLETQILGIERFCSEKNYEVVKIHHDVMSGGNRKRKGFNEARKDIEKGDFDIFLAYDISRIARDVFAFLKLFNLLREKNIKLVLINNQSLNTDSAMGRMILTILAAIFEFFRFDNAEKVRYSMAEKVKNTGDRMAGMSPYGYQMIDKKLVIKEDEAEEIKEMFEFYNSGESLRSVATKLKMSPQSVRNRLNNPAYVGKNVYGILKMNKETFKFEKNKDLDSIVKVAGSWEAIIDKATFEKAQKRLIKNKERNQRYIDTSNDTFLLSSLLSCTCGGRLYGASYSKGTRHYYKCKSCGKHIKRDILENELINELVNTNEFDVLNKKIKKSHKDISKKIEKIESEVKKLEEKENRMIDFLADGTLTKEKYQTFLDKNNNEKANLILEKVKLENQNKENSEETEKVIDYDMIELFKQIIKDIQLDDREEVKILFRQMIDEILFDFETLKIQQIKFNIYKNSESY